MKGLAVLNDKVTRNSGGVIIKCSRVNSVNLVKFKFFPDPSNNNLVDVATFIAVRSTTR